jgi:hypothetical protein
MAETVIVDRFAELWAKLQAAQQRDLDRWADDGGQDRRTPWQRFRWTQVMKENPPPLILRAIFCPRGEPRMDAHLSPKAIAQMEAAFRNDEEAHTLLDLINAEFQSDPMSVQCFDLRIVERVKRCVEARRKDPRLI